MSLKRASERVTIPRYVSEFTAVIPTAVPEGVETTSLVKTRELWRLTKGILGDANTYYLEQHAIHKDDDGDYVWKVLNPDDGPERSGPWPLSAAVRCPCPGPGRP